MAARLIPAYQTFHTSNGVSPLSGGLIHFFVSESVSTDKDTFSDDTLLTANTNPLVLDSAGRVQVDVWGDGLYKMVVADSSDVTIDTFDPISGGVSVTPVDTIAALTALLEASLSDGLEMDVSGYFAQGDGGGGRFFWNATSTATDNGGTVLAPDVTDGTGRWIRIVNGSLNTNMFGAALGQADDTTRVQAAVTAAENDKLIWSNGTHVITADITTSASVDWVAEGPNTLVDGSGGTYTNDVLNITGELTQIEELNANVSLFDKSIVLASTPSLVENDVFIIFNPTNSSWLGSQTEYRAGEFCRVHSISVNTVTLWNGLYDDYVVANVDLYKLTALTVRIDGLDVISITAGSVAGISIDLATNVYLTNLKGSGSAFSNTLVSRSYNVNYQLAETVLNAPAAGLQYGLTIANCQNGTITGSQLFATRHGLNFGGLDATGGVSNRNFQISNMQFFNADAGVGASEMHGNAEDIHHHNCVFHSGINFGGKNMSYTGGVAYNVESSLACALGAEIKGGTFVFDGVKFITSGKTVGRGLLFADIDANTVEDFTLIVTPSCIFEGQDQSGESVVRVNNNGSTAKVNTRVVGTTNFTVQPAGFLNLDLNSGTAASDFIVVGDIVANASGMSYMLNDGDYSALGVLRMPEQEETWQGTTIANATVTSSAFTFRHPYPVKPKVVTGLSGRDGASRGLFTGGLAGNDIVQAITNTNTTLRLLGDSATAFTAGDTFDITARAKISDV